MGTLELVPINTPRGVARHGEVSDLAREFIKAARAQNTVRGYRSDLADFVAWGGVIPASPELVAEYLAERAQELKPSTLERRLAALRLAHQAAGYESPTEHALVREVMRGIRRAKGRAPRRVRPVLFADLVAMLAGCRDDGLKGLRDAALLTFGLALGARCSELLALTVEDLEETAEGLRVTIRRSKTDQEGQGRVVAVPQGHTVCPVRALKAWLVAAGITTGPIFRSVDRHGNVGEALTRQAVARIIKARAEAAGLDAARYSTHSLRAGLVTEAARQGVPLHKIMEQTGHKAADTVMKYVRDARLFEQNAAGAIFGG